MKKRLLIIFVTVGFVSFIIFVVVFLSHNKTKKDNVQSNITNVQSDKTNIETEKKEIDDYHLIKNALKTKNDIYCKRLKEGNYDQCVYSVAVYHKDSDFCQKINDPNLKKECLENLEFEKIITGSDVNECFNLEVDKFRKQCLKDFFVKYYNDIDKCKKFTDDTREFCESVVYRNIAISKHNEEMCYKITDNNIKDNCLSELKKIKPPLDNDGDGLSDSEELSYGTDPFSKDTDNDGLSDKEELKTYHTNPRNKDTDGDGYSDGDEVKNGFNPLGEGKL